MSHKIAKTLLLSALMMLILSNLCPAQSTKKPIILEEPTQPTQPAKPRQVSVTGITLNNTKLDLLVNDTHTLVATVEPTNATNKKIVWESNAPAIVVVDVNGKIAAIAEGRAIVTAKSASNPNVTVFCVININPSPEPVKAPPEPEIDWNDLSALASFLDRKGDSPSKSAVQTRYETLVSERWQAIRESTDLSVLSGFLHLARHSASTVKVTAQSRYNDEKAWSDAKKDNTITSYENYLKGNTAKRYAQNARDNLEREYDEKAWSDAKREHTLTSYENYLKGNTAKRYAQNARSLLERDYPVHFKAFSDRNDVDNMENMYNRYVSMFPNGSERQNMQSTLCKTIERQGFALSSNRRSISDLQKSNEILRKRQNMCSYSSTVNRKINSNNRKIKDLRRPSGHFFMGYTNVSEAPIGFTLGWLSQRSLGFYLAARCNMDGITSGKDELINDLPENFFDDYYISWSKEVEREIKYKEQIYFSNAGRYERPFTAVTDIITPLRDGEFTYGNLELLAGLNKRLFYPLWVYAGGGVVMRNRLCSADVVSHIAYVDYEEYIWTYYSNGTPAYGTRSVTTYSTEYNTVSGYAIGDKEWLPMIDAGIQLRLSVFYFSVGVRSIIGTDVSGLTFGGGFAF